MNIFSLAFIMSLLLGLLVLTLPFVILFRKGFRLSRERARNIAYSAKLKNPKYIAEQEEREAKKKKKEEKKLKKEMDVTQKDKDNPNVIEELEKLVSLKKKGLLTEDEFNAAKAKLLNT